MRNTALACTLLALLARPSAAATPAAPGRVPELYIKFELANPAGRELTVNGRIQYAVPESLDLVRWEPEAARLPRLEMMLGAEGLILHPRHTDPQSFRTTVVRGAPLEYHYTLAFAPTDSLPQAWGAEFVCTWLGSTVLAVRGVSDAGAGAPAVERLLVGAELPLKWKLSTPWPQRDGLAHPADLEDCVDNFVGFGLWRTHTTIVREATACTLTTAIAPMFAAASDSSWMQLARQVMLPRMPARNLGRAWVAIAPAARARAWVARRSALVVCSPDSLPPSDWDAITRRTRGR